MHAPRASALRSAGLSGTLRLTHGPRYTPPLSSSSAPSRSPSHRPRHETLARRSPRGRRPSRPPMLPMCCPQPRAPIRHAPNGQHPRGHPATTVADQRSAGAAIRGLRVRRSHVAGPARCNTSATRRTNVWQSAGFSHESQTSRSVPRRPGALVAAVAVIARCPPRLGIAPVTGGRVHPLFACGNADPFSSVATPHGGLAKIGPAAVRARCGKFASVQLWGAVRGCNGASLSH